MPGHRSSGRFQGCNRSLVLLAKDSLGLQIDESQIKSCQVFGSSIVRSLVFLWDSFPVCLMLWQPPWQCPAISQVKIPEIYLSTFLENYRGSGPENYLILNVKINGAWRWGEEIWRVNTFILILPQGKQELMPVLTARNNCLWFLESKEFSEVVLL